MNSINNIRAELEYQILLSNMISTLLENPTNTNAMKTLLSKKKKEAYKLLILIRRKYDTIFQSHLCAPCSFQSICLQNFNTTNVLNNHLLFERIALLPDELIKYIGQYSHAVINQKKLVRIEFYIKWFKMNTDRILNMLKKWKKNHCGFVLDKIKFAANPYYNNCKIGSSSYKKGDILIFRSRIERLVEEIGERSHQEKYSLLLAIEKFDARK